jgi:hypothetical protein
MSLAPGREAHGGAGGEDGTRGGGRGRVGATVPGYADAVAVSRAWLTRHQAEVRNSSTDAFWPQDADRGSEDGAGEPWRQASRPSFHRT